MRVPFILATFAFVISVGCRGYRNSLAIEQASHSQLGFMVRKINRR